MTRDPMTRSRSRCMLCSNAYKDASPMTTIQQRATAIRRVYADYARKLAQLQKRHREEVERLLRELEQRKMEAIRKTLLDR